MHNHPSGNTEPSVDERYLADSYNSLGSGGSSSTGPHNCGQW
ncbi:hypothetical protein DKB71_17425 [Pseudomonas sp. PLMAX]